MARHKQLMPKLGGRHASPKAGPKLKKIAQDASHFLSGNGFLSAYVNLVTI